MYRRFNVEQAKEIRLWIEHIIVPAAIIAVVLSPKIRKKIADITGFETKNDQEIVL